MEPSSGSSSFKSHSSVSVREDKHVLVTGKPHDGDESASDSQQKQRCNIPPLACSDHPRAKAEPQRLFPPGSHFPTRRAPPEHTLAGGKAGAAGFKNAVFKFPCFFLKKPQTS